MKTKNQNMIDFRDDKRFKLMRSINRFLFKPALGKKVPLQFSISRKILPDPPEVSIVPTIFDFDMIVRPNIDYGEQLSGAIDRNLYYLGTYEISTHYTIKKFSGADSVIVDIGAYTGDMAIFSALIATKGHVFAFEPHPESYKYLLKNIKLNNLDNITAYNLALGSSQRTVDFYTDTEFVGGSSIQEDKDISPIKVKMNKLDNVLPKDMKVDVIKIDTEGQELDILKGAEKAINKQQPTLIVEYNPQTKNHRMLLKYLSKLKKYSFYIPEYGRHNNRRLVNIKNLTSYDGKLINIICVPERFSDLML